MIHVKFTDTTQANEARLKREKHLKNSKALDRKELLHGVLISILVAFSIATLLFIVFYKGLSDGIDAFMNNPMVSTIIVCCFIMALLAWWLIVKKKKV